MQGAEYSKPSGYSWGVILGVAGLLAFLRLPFLAFPSVDDVGALYASYVEHANQSWVNVNLIMNRLTVVPIYAAAHGLGLPSFALALVAYLPNSILLALLCYKTLTLVGARLNTLQLFCLTAFASLHAGFAEAESYWIIKLNLMIAYGAMVLFLMMWERRPEWRVVATTLMIATVALAYQGALNVALTVLTLLAAAEIRNGFGSRKEAALFFLSMGAAVIVGVLIPAGTLSILRATGHVWGEYFTPLPLSQLPAKIARVFKLYVDQLIGNAGYPSVVSRQAVLALSVAAVLLGFVQRAFTVRVWVAVAFAIAGVTLASLQLPSLTFSQQHYAVRSYLHLYLGFAGVICLAWSSWARPSGVARAVVGTGLVAAAFVIVFTVNAWMAASYVVTRSRDFGAAASFAQQLEAAKFDWNRPIAVSFQPWQLWTQWLDGLTTSMMPLLSAQWSAHHFVGFVAGQKVVAPTAEIQQQAEAFCQAQRGQVPAPKVFDQGNYVALCM